MGYNRGMKKMTISAQIRKAIETIGMSQYEIAKLSGVTQAGLSRFMWGKRGLTLLSVDRLAETLRFRLQSDGQKERHGGNGFPTKRPSELVLQVQERTRAVGAAGRRNGQGRDATPGRGR